MQKRILGILLTLCMVLMLAPATVLADSSTSFTVTADKTEASPGETITFTVTMGAVEKLKYLALGFEIPEGLTIVNGSGTAPEGLKDQMKADTIMCYDSHKVFYAFGCNYTSGTSTELMIFQCKVNDNAAPGDKMVNAHFEDKNGCLDTDGKIIAATFIPATVKVLAAADMPQTGDNSHMTLWIALFFVSGAGAIATTVYSRKRRSAK